MTDTLRLRQANGHMIEPATEQARIIDARLHELGSSWSALGDAIGLTRSYLSHIKAGRSTLTNPATIEKIAAVLKIDADPLYLAAGKIPPDVQQILLDQPHVLGIVRKCEADPDPT